MSSLTECRPFCPKANVVATGVLHNAKRRDFQIQPPPPPHTHTYNTHTHNTHQRRIYASVTCVSIDSCNGLSFRFQAITWTSADLLSNKLRMHIESKHKTANKHQTIIKGPVDWTKNHHCMFNRTSYCHIIMAS